MRFIENIYTAAYKWLSAKTDRVSDLKFQLKWDREDFMNKDKVIPGNMETWITNNLVK